MWNFSIRGGKFGLMIYISVVKGGPFLRSPILLLLLIQTQPGRIFCFHPNRGMVGLIWVVSIAPLPDFSFLHYIFLLLLGWSVLPTFGDAKINMP